MPPSGNRSRPLLQVSAAEHQPKNVCLPEVHEPLGTSTLREERVLHAPPLLFGWKRTSHVRVAPWKIVLRSSYAFVRARCPRGSGSAESNEAASAALPPHSRDILRNDPERSRCGIWKGRSPAR